MAKKVIFDKEGKDTGEAYDPEEGYAAWAARQAAIGLAETPGTFATLGGLAKAGYDYATSGKDDKRTFGEHLLDPNGGKEKLEQYDNVVVESLRKNHPEASPEEINERFDKVRKHSKKYWNETADFYRSGVSFGRKWGVGTNEFFGDERLPTEKTQSDQVMNIIGGAAPLPVSGIVKATGAAGAKAATKIAETAAANRAVRYGLNAVEAVTPVTVVPEGASAAGRVGLNIGVGTAINQGARAYADEPSIIAAPVETAKTFFTKDDGSADITTIGAAGAVAAVIAGKTYKTLTKVKPHAPNAGPAREAMEGIANPEPNLTVSSLGSDIEPIRKSAKAAGLADEDVQILYDKAQRYAGPMAKSDHDAWMAEKVSPITERYVREDPKFQTLFEQHIADRSRVYGDVKAIKDIDEELASLQARYQGLRNAEPKTKVPGQIQKSAEKSTDVLDRIKELSQERQVRIRDADPNLRSSMMGDDFATVKARLKQSSSDPRIQDTERALGRLYNDLIDVNEGRGIINSATAADMKLAIKRGNYTLNENPMAQKSWLERAKTKATKWTEDHLIYTDTNGALALYRGVNNQRTRKGYLTYDAATGKEKVRYVNKQPDWTPQPRTNNPSNPFIELAHMSMRTRQAAHANVLMKEYFETMKNAPGNAGNRLVRLERIPHNLADSKLKEIISDLDAKTGPFKTAYFDGGDLVVATHNSKIIRDMFKFAPSAVVPILHQSRRGFQSWVTGAMNPTWAMIGMPWDVIMGSVFRNKQMAFGPISGLAHQALGRGSIGARIISAAGTPIDLAYNMLKMPLVASKAVLTEVMGGQLAKRWEAQLASNSGVISQIAKLPGGKEIVEKTVSAMSKAYDASWTHVTKAMKVGHVSNYSDEILSHIQSLDKLSKAYPMYKSAWSGYKSVLSVLHDVPKQMFLTQNLKMYRRELAKGRKLAKYVSEDFIANEARTIGGDLARTSGNKYIQQALSTVPYGNVALQSLRYTAHRVRTNGSEGMLRLAAMGSAAGWAYSYIASDPKAADWYFNQLPQEQRMQSLPIPNFIRHARRMMGEDLPMDDPSKEFLLVRMPPEMLPFIVPVMHGMMALGLISNKNMDVPPALGKDIGGMVDQVFGLGLPPMIQAGAAYFGQKVEPSKMMHGESPFREIRDITFGGVNKDKMSPQSRIPHAWHDVFNAMFGSVAGTLLEAGNYADIIYGKNKDMGEAVVEGAKKLAVERGSKVPYAAHIWPEVNRQYVFTPPTQELSNQMGILRKVNAQWGAEPELRMLFGKGGSKPNTTDYADVQGGGGGAPMADQDLQVIVADVHQSFFQGPMLKIQQERTRERKIHESLTIGAPTKFAESPLIRFKRAQEAAKKVNALDRELYSLYQDQWKEIATSPSGKAFEAKYGKLTPENLLKAAQASAREGGLQKDRP